MPGAKERHGLVLLEVIIALTILAVGATSMIALASESLDAVSRTDASERDLRRANGLMEAVSLWPREDLDRHLGDRPEGEWRLRIDRPVETLYVVSLADSPNGRVLFETSLYRAEGTNGAP